MEVSRSPGPVSKLLYLLSTSTALFCYFVLCLETRSYAIALAALSRSVLLMPHFPMCWVTSVASTVPRRETTILNDIYSFFKKGSPQFVEIPKIGLK